MVSLQDGRIIVPKKEFTIRATLECGQVFRYAREGPPASYRLVSGGRACRLDETGDAVVIRARRRDLPYFVRYFDLERSYRPLLARLRRLGGEEFRAAAAFAGTLRILRQDPFEALISFIISTNNTIARIRSIIEKLCASLGSPLPHSAGKNSRGPARGQTGDQTAGLCHAFPSPQELSLADEGLFRSLGCGYRAPWLYRASLRAASFPGELEGFSALPTEKLIRALQTFEGVGPKAADCIALFAYGRYDVFPVDTWVKKIYAGLFGRDERPLVMRKDLIARFGPFAGITQQYLFYYYRERSKGSAR